MHQLSLGLFRDQPGASYPSRIPSFTLTRLIHRCPAVSFPLFAPTLFSFRRTATFIYAGYTSRRAAGNGLTVGGEQLLPRKRFPSKLHLKNMIRLHSGGRAPDYRTDYVIPTSASALFYPPTAFFAYDFFLLADRLLVARSASHPLAKLLLVFVRIKRRLDYLTAPDSRHYRKTNF